MPEPLTPQRLLQILSDAPGTWNAQTNSIIHRVNVNQIRGWTQKFWNENKSKFNNVTFDEFPKRSGNWILTLFEPQQGSITVDQPGGISVIQRAHFLVNDRENTFTVWGETNDDTSEIFRILDNYSVVYTHGFLQQPKTGEMKATKGARHFIRIERKQSKNIARADIGMLYYFDSFLKKKGYETTIDDLRKKIHDDVIDVEAVAKPDPKTGKKFRFRDYQMKAIEAGLQHKNGILRLATGSGKTEIAIGLIGKLGEDTLFIVPNKNLADQTQKRLIRRGFGSVGIIYGDKKDLKNTPGLDVNVAVINSAERLLKKAPKGKTGKPPKRDSPEMAELKAKFLKFVQQANVVIFDEAHHVQAETYATFAEANPASFRYGLSATPFADSDLQTALVRSKLGDIIYDLSASKLILYEDGKQYISQPIIKLIANTIPPNVINKLKKRLEELSHEEKGGTKKYTSFVSACIVENDQRNLLIGNICAEASKLHMPTLVIAETIEHLVRLKLLLDSIGISNVAIASKEDKGEKIENESVNSRVKIIVNIEERKQAFADVASNYTAPNHVDVLIGTSGMVGEGLDIDQLMLCIIAQGGKSFTRTYQRIGRAMRIHENESTLFRQTHCLIVDILDGLNYETPGLTELQNPDTDATPGLAPMMYFGRHFLRRLKLYQAEPKFVIAWAKSFKDIFKVHALKGGEDHYINPWSE